MNQQQHFENYLQSNGIRSSTRRGQIVEIFLACERHVTAFELLALVQQKHPTIGIATIYRTLKLAVDSGIARATEFGDGNLRYEHDFGHEHHDHIICTRCGDVKEIASSKIESEQVRIAGELGYVLSKHKMVLYGTCLKCSSASKRSSA